MKINLIPWRIVWLALMAVWLFLSTTQAQNSQSGSLNIVYVMTDDQAPWTIGAYGNRESITPNMDRIAREGALFRQAFTVTPVCSPSRVAFLTGLYGTQVGITDWIAPNEAAAGLGLPPGTPTWPRVLQRNGYRTALFGKWHLGTQPQFHPSRHGFDVFFGSLAGSFEPLNPRLEKDGKVETRPGAGSDVVMDEALRFVEANRDRAFAALIHFREPHLPYTPMPAQDTALFKDLDPAIPNAKGLDTGQVKQLYREYYAAVHAVDRNLGRLLAQLDQLDLTRKTIVVFTSDHGYNIGQHGIHTKGNGFWMLGGGNGPKRPNMWDTSLRIPLLVRWPGVVKPGSEINEAVTNLDLLPSILGMLRVASLPVGPSGLRQNGLDFSPLLRGEKTVTWRDAVYGQYDLHNGGLAFMRMVRTSEWKLVRHHHENQMDELYDLKNDPDETRNLYNNAQHLTTRDELQTKLTAWQRSLDDPLLKEKSRLVTER